jgi:hypothetical protein
MAVLPFCTGTSVRKYPLTYPFSPEICSQNYRSPTFWEICSEDEPDGAVLHGRLLRHMAGASVGGWGGRVNPHIVGLMLAATTRAASWRIDVKDVLILVAKSWEGMPTSLSDLR